MAASSWSHNGAECAGVSHDPAHDGYAGHDSQAADGEPAGFSMKCSFVTGGAGLVGLNMIGSDPTLAGVSDSRAPTQQLVQIQGVALRRLSTEMEGVDRA